MLPHAFEWIHASMCTHACTNVRVCFADLEIRCQAPDHISGLSVALWFRSRVESSEVSTEDFHRSIPNKSIKQQKEVICKMKHFYARIVISCLFYWQQICLKSSMCKKGRCSRTICSDFKLASFISFHNTNLWPCDLFRFALVNVEIHFCVFGVYLCEMSRFLLRLCVKWIIKTLMS